MSASCAEMPTDVYCEVMDPYLLTLLAAGLMTLLGVAVYLYVFQPTLLDVIEAQRELVTASVERWFAVQPCFRCYEFEMRLLAVSPKGRSVHYQCVHCEKKMHAPAGTPDAPGVIEQLKLLKVLVEQYREKAAGREVEPTADELAVIHFEAPAAPLPYEQTSRTPIPEAVRGEVWRRDSGQCVKCGSKQNLQFDHIIPVSRGGANSVANIQLLCQPCNAAKGDEV